MLGIDFGLFSDPNRHEPGHRPHAWIRNSLGRCHEARWVTRHSVIQGQRLHFTGSGASLAWKWFKIWALTIITVGIYGFWAFNALQRWRLSHTVFA